MLHIVLNNFLLVINLLAIIVVVRSVHLENDVDEEKNNWYDIYAIVVVLLTKVVVELVEKKSQRNHHAVPNSKNQNQTIPVHFKKTILRYCRTSLYETGFK